MGPPEHAMTTPPLPTQKINKKKTPETVPVRWLFCCWWCLSQWWMIIIASDMMSLFFFLHSWERPRLRPPLFRAGGGGEQSRGGAWLEVAWRGAGMAGSGGWPPHPRSGVRPAGVDDSKMEPPPPGPPAPLPWPIPSSEAHPTRTNSGGHLTGAPLPPRRVALHVASQQRQRLSDARDPAGVGRTPLPPTACGCGAPLPTVHLHPPPFPGAPVGLCRCRCAP